MESVFRLMSRAKGYRTVLLNLALILIAAFGRDSFPLSQEEVDTLLLGVSTAGNLMLRFVTTGPVGQGERSAGAGASPA